MRGVAISLYWGTSGVGVAFEESDKIMRRKELSRPLIKDKRDDCY